MSEFKRENRYIVIKRRDLDTLYKDPTKYATTFGHSLALIAPHLPKREFLVIESDWPEYEPAWRMIERRMAGLPDELAALREELAALKELSVTNILLDIVPGHDGMGYEVFAKSVAEVCEKLGDFAMRAEELERSLTAAELRNAVMHEALENILSIYEGVTRSAHCGIECDDDAVAEARTALEK